MVPAMRRPLLFFFSALVLAGCTRGEPPSPVGVDGAVSVLPGPASAPASSAPAPTADAPDAAPARPVASGADPGSLPQTRDKPSAEGEAFEARAAALWSAIVEDDPDRAMPFFFPLSAYEQVKAIGNPAADWRRRLVAAYKRDIHALHKRLGDKAATAKLVRVAVPEERARWVEPDEEYNKLGYWRVYGTRIIWQPEPDAKERSFEITSLISWRGEWYVVHLTGFK